MFSRLRKARHGIAIAGAKSLLLILDAVEMGDLLSMIGFALLASGLWQIYRPAALIVPGAVLLWYALPSRPPFIAPQQKRKDVA